MQPRKVYIAYWNGRTPPDAKYAHNTEVTSLLENPLPNVMNDMIVAGYDVLIRNLKQEDGAVCLWADKVEKGKTFTQR